MSETKTKQATRSVATNGNAVRLQRLARRTNGDDERICVALGMSLGDGESAGLAFTFCGGQLVNGDRAPEWIAANNGNCVDEIADEAIERNAVEPVGRWGWQASAPSD